MKQKKVRPSKQTVSIDKHDGEKEWMEQRELENITNEEYYDLWEDDRV